MGGVGELRNKTKLQPSSVEVELWLSLAIIFPGVTVMLSLAVFMNIVSEQMPITSDTVPLVGKLFLVCNS